MGEAVHCLALDFGASSARLMELSLLDGQLKLDELSRIAHAAREEGGHLVWDYPAIYGHVEASLKIAGRLGGQRFSSIGVDSWGVDYVLLDEDGKLLGRPVSYRDARTDGQIERFTSEHFNAKYLFENTGLPTLNFNTLFQLYAQSQAEPDLVKRADRLLFTADYAHFWLGGRPANERTLASTSQLLSLDGDWCEEVLASLSLKRSALERPVPAGTDLGELSPALQAGCGLTALRIIAPCAHDTQSAILAVPVDGDDDWAYLSSGTWSILGAESAVPYCGEQAFKAGFGNEQGYGGTYCIQSTVTGLWLIQEIQRVLGSSDAQSLASEAQKARAFRSLINPADVRFFHPADMVAEIRAACRAADEPVPETPGELARCAYDSLALLYGQRLDLLAKISGRKFARLYVVGGGSQATLLNRLCAGVIGIPVYAGPCEATAIGNGLAQMIALGAIEDVGQARRLIARSFPPHLVEPQQIAGLDDARARFERISQL